MLIPMPGYVVVELADQYRFAQTPDKQYQVKSSGIVLKVSDEQEDYLLNKMIYFDGVFKDSVIEDKYAFVKVEDVAGYKDE